MKLHKGARKELAKRMPEAEILAVVPLSMTASTAGVHSDGQHRGASTVFSLPYAERLGLDLGAGDLRHELVDSIMVLTPTHVRFHSVNQWSMKPKPKDLIDEVPRGDVTVEWFDPGGDKSGPRVFHLRFADGGQVLAATVYRVPMRSAPAFDEPDLFVRELGPAAVRIEG